MSGKSIERLLEDSQSSGKKIRMTEAAMQYVLFRHNRCKPIFTNIQIGCNEWDAISVSQSGYPTCYEIKLSKSDFKRDFEKDRHELLLGRHEKHPIRGYTLGIIPKYVYYVIHGFKLDPEEIPDYAGLIVVGDNGYPVDIIQAPTLWKKKMTDRQREQLYRITAHRYIFNTADRNKKLLDGAIGRQ